MSNAEVPSPTLPVPSYCAYCQDGTASSTHLREAVRALGEFPSASMDAAVAASIDIEDLMTVVVAHGFQPTHQVDGFWRRSDEATILTDMGTASSRGVFLRRVVARLASYDGVPDAHVLAHVLCARDQRKGSGVREVPFGTEVPGKKVGVFVALTAWCRLYADYEDPTMTPDARRAFYPVVLLMHRWDEGLGFVGGFRDHEEPLIDVARREFFEELGIAPGQHKFEPFIAHETPRMTVHLYRIDLGSVPIFTLRDIFGLAALKAPHAVSEGSPFWAQLYDYGKGRGWPRLRSNSALLTAVGEELDAVRAAMLASPPTETALRAAILREDEHLDRPRRTKETPLLAVHRPT